jgi:hypothetical protein
LGEESGVLRRGGPNLFGSEYAFDSTGFESTQAIARYAVDHPTTPGITPEAATKFATTQIQANLFCRGVIEKAYYYYGSDYRGGGAGDAFTLTYMSPMGGWGVLWRTPGGLAVVQHRAANPNSAIRHAI